MNKNPRNLVKTTDYFWILGTVALEVKPNESRFV
jgi:hypothetical protein